MILNIVLGILIGGALGAVLGYFGKCASGACPLTATPYRGAVYGVVVGVAIAFAFSRARRTEPTRTETESARAETESSAGEVEKSAKNEVLDVTDETFEQEVLNSSLPVLVDMWAPWCGPCRMVSPVVEQLAGENAGNIKVCKLNVSENKETARRYGIQAIPSVLFFRDGVELKALRIVGARRKTAYRRAINEATGPAAGD